MGAQPSESVQKLFKIVKLDERYQRLKSGEEKATLLAEAENIYKNRVKDPSTALTKESK